MQAQHPSSSRRKAITPPVPGRSTFNPTGRQVATAVIGAAVITYLVHKTPDAHKHLERLANMANTQGDLSDRDAAVVADLLASPNKARGEQRHVF